VVDDQRRWTLPCRDEAGRERVHNVEVTSHGVVRLEPPMVGPTLWEPEQIDALLVALVEARRRAVKQRREGG
jgi:hypothetical protein